MAFIQDNRVRIIEPRDRTTVTLPVTLRWTLNGFTVTGRNGEQMPNAGYFAIFIDRPPIPPGQSLEWYASQDDSCGDNSCGTVSNISGVHTTKETTLPVAQLPALRTREDLETHEAVIILMDGTGRRIGESAFYVRFNYKREV